MEEQSKKKMTQLVRDFRLPRYEELPNVGYFLDQVTQYITECLKPFSSFTLTGSMISNYVKMGLIDKPVRKTYGREQMAYLIFIAMAKTVLSLEDIQLFIRLQKETYDTKTAYNYFCSEFENILHFVYGLKEKPEKVGKEDTDEKHMLQSTIITVAYKVYLDQCFQTVRDEKG